MSDPATLLLILLALPTVAAVVVAGLGPRRGEIIRWISLATALVVLFLAAYVTWMFAQPRLTGKVPPATEFRTFQPEYVTRIDLVQVPGAVEHPVDKQPTAIRFFVGLDGLNVWLVLLTAVLFLP